jgi:hypothetical protein
MSINVDIVDSVNAREIPSSLVLSWQAGVPVRVRDIIRERVRMEYERQADELERTVPEQHPLVKLLTRANSAGRERQLETAINAALDGFLNQSFFISIDGKPAPELETEFLLHPASTVRFVRLVPLVGG